MRPQPEVWNLASHSLLPVPMALRSVISVISESSCFPPCPCLFVVSCCCANTATEGVHIEACTCVSSGDSEGSVSWYWLMLTLVLCAAGHGCGAARLRGLKQGWSDPRNRNKY